MCDVPTRSASEVDRWWRRVLCRSPTRGWVARVIAGRNRNIRERVEGHAVGEHAMEPVEGFLEARAEWPGGNRAAGEAPLGSFDDVDVLGVNREPEVAGVDVGVGFDRAGSEHRAGLPRQAGRDRVEAHEPDVVRQHREDDVREEGDESPADRVGRVETVRGGKAQPVVALIP